MPRFSIIVPAYEVQAFLPECLDSVLSQSFRDFELIAVDDASPDGSGRIIDGYAAGDGRIAAVHLAENAGLGGARNAGLARATGDYLVFLDSDDTLLPGSLAALAARLDRTGDPDVVVFDYARAYESGETVRNTRAGLLARRGPEVFDVLDRPDLLRLLPVVWNKTYRRGWVEQLGLAFPPGYYEDVAWTYPALLAAARIACLDRVCVLYRQRDGGSILGTESRRHFDVFDQYDRVFAFLDTRPGLERLRPVLFRRMVDHVCAVLNMPRRVPPGARREFFGRGHESFLRHRPAGYAPPPGPAGVRHRLLGAGTPLLYQVLLRSRRAWLKARSLAAPAPAPPARYALSPSADAVEAAHGAEPAPTAEAAVHGVGTTCAAEAAHGVQPAPAPGAQTPGAAHACGDAAGPDAVPGPGGGPRPDAPPEVPGAAGTSPARPARPARPAHSVRPARPARPARREPAPPCRD